MKKQLKFHEVIPIQQLLNHFKSKVKNHKPEISSILKALNDDEGKKNCLEVLSKVLKLTYKQEYSP
jgi:hypothetical protein